MKNLRILIFSVVSLVIGAVLGLAHAQSTNLPPEVSIQWPTDDCFNNDIFLLGTHIKIKATASDPDGSIAQVQFFADAELVGVASNAPFSVIWTAQPNNSTRILKAVAVDNQGTNTESAPVWVAVAGNLPYPEVFEVMPPINGSVFAAPGNFVFSAELLASRYGDTGPVEFFVGVNSVGVVTQSGPFTAETPLYTISVTNVPEGDYQLSVQQMGYATATHAPGTCDGVFIHVVKLAMQSPRRTPDGRFEFDVVTSYPTNQNVIQASSNLLNWTAISTNVPFSNTFTFTEPTPATNAPRFYRVFVPAQ